MEEIKKIEEELERTRMELNILYEISNAMRTTLKLDEVLYIILTGVTAHIGLGFNRAILFLVNDKDAIIEGKMAIGPENGEEASRIWRQIEGEKMDMDDLISAFKASDTESRVVEGAFNKHVRMIKVPLLEQKGGLLAISVLDGMPLLITKETIKNYLHDPVVQLLRTDELIIVPLKAKDKVNGLIMADNFITKKPITKDDIRMLIMLANQAGLAIENSQLYEKAVIRAHTDALSELWNHGYFQYILQSELEKSKAVNSPLSLIMVDIDNFKVYNDTFGHQAGDLVIKELAAVLKSQSRKMDFPCRYGGEEFTIILPTADKREAFMIAERLREDIERHAFHHEDVLPNGKLTVSLGLSTFPENGNSAAELIAHSDKALYEAKHRGRNNTCL